MATSPFSLSLLSDVPLDANTISQDRLNISGKVRSSVFPWNGQFSPQLVHVFLETYGAAGDFVVDPFMGSGPVLVEAARLQRRALGSEINPAACKMAQAYTFVNVPENIRTITLEHLGNTIYDAFEGPSLFSGITNSGQQAGPRGRLLDLWEQQEEGSLAWRLFETLIVLLDFYTVDLSSKKMLATIRTDSARLFTKTLSTFAWRRPLSKRSCPKAWQQRR